MREQSKEMLDRYPDRVPVFLKKSKACKRRDVPDVKKNKYLAPRTITVAEFSAVVRRRMKLDPAVAIFFMVNIGQSGGGVLLPSCMTMGEAYDEFGRDMHLTITYSGENTFG